MVRFTFYFFLFALSACASTQDEQLAKLRAQVPSVTGGYTYKQYVVVNSGDPEVLGDEGDLYIAPTTFTDEQVKHIGSSESGKIALQMASQSIGDELLNLCFSARSPDKGQAGAAVIYSSLVVAWASDVDGETKFTLYSWPDAWYMWRLKFSGSGVVAKDNEEFGWQSSRIALTPDPSVDLDKCLHFRDGS